MVDNSIVLLKILGKEFKVTCPPEDKPDLLASADFLNEKLNILRSRNKITGNDRLAITVALNITHELLACQKQLNKHESDTSSDDLKALQKKIDGALR